MKHIKLSELLLISMFIFGMATAIVHKFNGQAISTIDIVEVSSQQEIDIDPTS